MNTVREYLIADSAVHKVGRRLVRTIISETSQTSHPSLLYNGNWRAKRGLQVLNGKLCVAMHGRIRYIYIYM